ncbi:hypothetical protein, partial [Roseinatronobacter sp.]|uniref:hypothetical protein n=1 Tax=Roseinatronobacter sp. TaxID=1945755 RepID=UPI0025ED0A74
LGNTIKTRKREINTARKKNPEPREPLAANRAHTNGNSHHRGHRGRQNERFDLHHFLFGRSGVMLQRRYDYKQRE